MSLNEPKSAAAVQRWTLWLMESPSVFAFE